MKSIIRPEVFIPLILLSGVVQYAPVAIEAAISGNVSLWNIDRDTLESTGSLKYIKDLFVFALSIFWIILINKFKLPELLAKIVRVYFLWLASIIILGLLSHLVYENPSFFLYAGMRWLLLLNSAFGLFIISGKLLKIQKHQLIYWFLIFLLAFDSYIVFLQFIANKALFGLGFAEARLTGLFGNAGVAAYFSLASALISLHLHGISSKKRISITLLCLVLSFSSGTRFITFAIFFIFITQLYEMSSLFSKKLVKLVKIFILLISIFATYQAYQYVNAQVNRGNAISQQLEKGGRIGNLLDMTEKIYSASPLEVMIGRGLGTGTNTAVISSIARGIDPDTYPFNWLIDNAFITLVFQIGIIGSVIFWLGIYKFIKLIKPKNSPKAKRYYLLTTTIFAMSLIVGNPFEQYFLMLSFAISLGFSFWLDRSNVNIPKRKHAL